MSILRYFTSLIENTIANNDTLNFLKTPYNFEWDDMLHTQHNYNTTKDEWKRNDWSRGKSEVEDPKFKCG